MAKRIDPLTLPLSERERLLRNEARELELAEIALGWAKGRARAKFRRYVEARKANCLALADSIHGAPCAEIAAMSDADLVRELTA